MEPIHRSLKDIIRQLGGPKSVAIYLQCRVTAVSNWHTRGVPKARIIDLHDMAKELGVSLSLDDIKAADAEIPRL